MVKEKISFPFSLVVMLELRTWTMISVSMGTDDGSDGGVVGWPSEYGVSGDTDMGGDKPGLL
jgi:hypothetical protein